MSIKLIMVCASSKKLQGFDTNQSAILSLSPKKDKKVARVYYIILIFVINQA